jgi:hypothetical protein
MSSFIHIQFIFLFIFSFVKLTTARTSETPQQSTDTPYVTSLVDTAPLLLLNNVFSGELVIASEMDRIPTHTHTHTHNTPLVFSLSLIYNLDSNQKLRVLEANVDGIRADGFDP